MAIPENAQIIDGIALADHRKLGRSFAVIFELLDEMADSCDTPSYRRLAYTRINEAIDSALDMLAEVAGDAFRDLGIDANPYPLFSVDGNGACEMTPEDDAGDDENFVDELEHCKWTDWAEVFPLMCPMTGRNCHSKCACYRDERTETTAIGTELDLAYRVDGYTSGRCEKFGFAITTNRD